MFAIFLIFFPIFCFASFDIVDEDTINFTNSYKPLKNSKIHNQKPITKSSNQNQKIKKIIYLTFDDGPLLGSNNIISVIQEQNVKATMFMVGKHIQRSKYRFKTFKRAINEPLILVANHTYSHADGRYKNFYSNKERLLEDIDRMDNILLENDPNYIFPYCRLAGRNVWRLPKIYRDDPCIPKKYCETDKYDKLKKAGYHIFGWDYQWAYNPKNGQVYKSPQNVVEIIEKIFKKGKTRLKGKFILLMHDFSFREKFHGKEELRTLIKLLKELGWKFESIDTYL